MHFGAYLYRGRLYRQGFFFFSHMKEPHIQGQPKDETYENPYQSIRDSSDVADVEDAIPIEHTFDVIAVGVEQAQSAKVLFDCCKHGSVSLFLSTIWVSLFLCP